MVLWFAFYVFGLKGGASCYSGPRIRRGDPEYHQAMGFRSRRNWPVRVCGASSASQTIVSAPSSTERGAASPPISVRTQPGETEFTAKRGRAAAKCWVRAFSAGLGHTVSRSPVLQPVGQLAPLRLETLTTRGASLFSSSAWNACVTRSGPTVLVGKRVQRDFAIQSEHGLSIVKENGRVIHQHVEAIRFRGDRAGRGGDAGRIAGVEQNELRASNLGSGPLARFLTPSGKKNARAAGGQLPGRLQADPFGGARHENCRVRSHEASALPRGSAAWRAQFFRDDHHEQLLRLAEAT